jgi:hypothetical protein
MSLPIHLSSVGLMPNKHPMFLRPVQIANGDEPLSLLTEDRRGPDHSRAEQERPSVPTSEAIRDELGGGPALVMHAPERSLAGLVGGEVSQCHAHLVNPINPLEEARSRAISRREQE